MSIKENCFSCKSKNTEITEDEKHIFIQCENCGSCSVTSRAEKKTEEIIYSKRIPVNIVTDEFYHLFIKNKYGENKIFNDESKFCFEI